MAPYWTAGPLQCAGCGVQVRHRVAARPGPAGRADAEGDRGGTTTAGGPGPTGTQRPHGCANSEERPDGGGTGRDGETRRRVGAGGPDSKGTVTSRRWACEPARRGGGKPGQARGVTGSRGPVTGGRFRSRPGRHYHAGQAVTYATGSLRTRSGTRRRPLPASHPFLHPCCDSAVRSRCDCEVRSRCDSEVRSRVFDVRWRPCRHPISLPPPPRP